MIRLREDSSKFTELIVFDDGRVAILQNFGMEVFTEENIWEKDIKK
jgi:hypothetical protein